LVERCLEKDPKRRLRDIGDAWAELQADTVKAVVRPTLPPAGSRFTVPILASALIAALTGVAWLSTRSVTVPRSVQFTFGAADETQLEPLTPVPSPDGTQIAFVARSESGERSLWIREIGSTVRPVDDTAGVQTAPFWSPDGRWVGFFAQGRLKKVSLDGGPALTIATISNLLGATWNRDNVIVLAPVNRTVLHKVSAFGGTPEPITTLNAERKENSHRWPSFLPDGRRFLFTARSDVIENNLIYVGSLGSTVVTPLVAAQSNASYAAGYLLFAREGTLLAQRFDVDRQVVSGESLSVVSPIAHNTPSSSAAFRISSDSTTLAYRPGALFRSSLTWFDRTGAKVGEVGEADNFTDVRLSPDGKVAAVVVPDPDSGNRDIWLVDLGTGTKTRFTTNPANDWQMTWAPDSRRLAFASDRNGPSSVYVKAIDGNEELLLRFPDRGVFPKDWPTDNLLTLGIDTPGGISSVAAVRLTGDRTPFAVGEGSRQRENDLMLTRDTTAMAFVSRESGLDEVYVAPFPKGGRRRVSVGGGSFPRWKAGGDELYYVSADGSIMRVPVRRGETIRPEVPIPLLRPCGGLTLRQQTPYDVTADGSRFLTICAPSTITPEIAVSVNWAPPLK
jgi:Tol biopolymer transport system component